MSSVVDQYQPKLIAFAGWKSEPSSKYTSQDVTEEEIMNLLKNDCLIEIDTKTISLLKEEKEIQDFQVQPYDDPKEPEAKPNLLIATCTILLNETKKYIKSEAKKTWSVTSRASSETTISSYTESVDDLFQQLSISNSQSPSPAGTLGTATTATTTTSSTLSSSLQQQLIQKPSDELKKLLIRSLGKYCDIIMPRKPLNSIMNNKEDWEIYICKPFEEGPLFIDRVKSYETNEGSPGMLFERKMSHPSNANYHRVYAITQGKLGNIRLVLTGEIDCVDSTGNIVEIKSKPAWKQQDIDRIQQTYIQSRLLGTNTRIIIGGFSAERGIRDGPITFKKSDIKYKTLQSYGSSLQNSEIERIFNDTIVILEKIQKKCIKIGAVYHARSLDQKLSLRRCSEGEVSFPITENVLLNCASACYQTIKRNERK